MPSFRKNNYGKNAERVLAEHCESTPRLRSNDAVANKALCVLKPGHRPGGHRPKATVNCHAITGPA